MVDWAHELYSDDAALERAIFELPVTALYARMYSIDRIATARDAELQKRRE